MMEIIKHGDFRKPTVFVATCGECGCRFRFDSEYIEAVLDHNKSVIRCPECKRIGYVFIDKLEVEENDDEEEQ